MSDYQQISGGIEFSTAKDAKAFWVQILKNANTVNSSLFEFAKALYTVYRMRKPAEWKALYVKINADKRNKREQASGPIWSKPKGYAVFQDVVYEVADYSLFQDIRAFFQRTSEEDRRLVQEMLSLPNVGDNDFDGTGFDWERSKAKAPKKPRAIRGKSIRIAGIALNLSGKKITFGGNNNHVWDGFEDSVVGSWILDNYARNGGTNNVSVRSEYDEDGWGDEDSEW